MKKKAVWILAAALLVRLIPAILYYNSFDIEPYHLQWALYGADDLFGLYSRKLGLFYLDYPPLLPILFSLFGHPLAAAVEMKNLAAEMFLLKFWPVLFDMLSVALLLRLAVCRKTKSAWFAAILWAFNPAAVFNCSFWGQTDTVMCFFLLWMLLSLHQNRSMPACVAFALGCLSKLQMAYFAPVLLIGLLFCTESWRRRAAALVCGGALGLLVWLPFQMRSGWNLPLSIYFGGFSKYGAVHLNAGNLYAFGRSLNGLDDSAYMMGLFPFSSINRFVWAAALVFLFLYVFLRRTGRTSLALPKAAALYWMMIYLFTTRMHERYLIPALLFCTVAVLLQDSRTYRAASVVLALTICVNQAVTLCGEAIGNPYAPLFTWMLRGCAAVQLAVFAALCADAIRSLVYAQNSKKMSENA